MSDITIFANKLRKLVSETGRPFVCAGSPLSCRIFLIGANPATVMSRPFWDYWNDETGFDKSAWFTQYLADRACAPLKPGKTRRAAVSSTRQRLNWISEGVASETCLETNVFSEPTECLDDLAKDQRSTRIFEFLVQEVKPRILMPHGKDARQCIERLIASHLPENEVVETSVMGVSTKILAVSHLSRGWSKSSTLELGQRLSDLCSNNGDD